MIVKYAGVTPVLLTNVVGRTAGSPDAQAGAVDPMTATERTSATSFEYLKARFSSYVQRVVLGCEGSIPSRSQRIANINALRSRPPSPWDSSP